MKAIILGSQAAAPAKSLSGPATTWTDDRLVQACLKGDEESWSVLIDRYKRLIYSIPVKYGFSLDEASDVFQDICVELVAQLSQLREPRALPKWLMQVAAHKCERHRQSRRRAADTQERDFDALQDIADTGRRSDELLLEVEREQALRDAVSALSPRCRQLVRMLFFESPARPYKEIADSLDLALGSIGFIRGRCLHRLRAELEKHGL